MLPGFRFLFAAIMLSLSLLVFGLGAAALLRAAHESFASNPSWRAAPEVTFAQRSEPTLPVLATLRVDTPVTEKAPEQAPPTTSSAEPTPVMSAPATSEQVAALNPVDAAPSEAKTSETKTSETTTSEGAPPAMLPAENLSPAATPPATEATATGDQTAIAANTTPAVPPGASEPTTVQPEPTKPEPTNASQEMPAADQAGSAATKIATLGGPPVDIIDANAAKDKTAKPDPAKTDPDTIKRRMQAKRALYRRRLAARARLAQQQFLAGPFAQQPFQPATSAAPRP
jgi:hypothetical protein